MRSKDIPFFEKEIEEIARNYTVMVTVDGFTKESLGCLFRVISETGKDITLSSGESNITVGSSAEHIENHTTIEMDIPDRIVEILPENIVSIIEDIIRKRNLEYYTSSSVEKVREIFSLVKNLPKVAICREAGPLESTSKVRYFGNTSSLMNESFPQIEEVIICSEHCSGNIQDIRSAFPNAKITFSEPLSDNGRM